MGQDSFTHQPRGSPAGKGPLPRQMLVEGCFLSLAEQGKRFEGGHGLACCPRPLWHLLRQMTEMELEWYSKIHPLPASVCDSELQTTPPAWPHTTPPAAPRLKETQGSPTRQSILCFARQPVQRQKHVPPVIPLLGSPSEHFLRAENP